MKLFLIRKPNRLFYSAFTLAALTSLTACGKPAVTSNDTPKIEYIAHASFRITDGDKSSLVIDPFNSRIWLGYSYPKDLDADAVLITHPHFDHDASYYFDAATPVYREPVTVKIGRMSVRGIATEHDGAEDMKASGRNPMNTVWVINAGGKTVLHLGDTRPLTDGEIALIGPVDVILTNLVDAEEVARMKSAFNAATIIPMHYKLPSLAPEGGSGLDTLDQWAKKKPKDAIQITRLAGNISPIEALPSGLIAFSPMETVAARPEIDAEISAVFKGVNGNIRSEAPDWEAAETGLKAGLKIDPGNMSIYRFLAFVYDKQSKPEESAVILEEGLIKATDLDWSAATGAHNGLVKAYEKLEKDDLAQGHRDWLANNPSSYYLAQK